MGTVLKSSWKNQLLPSANTQSVNKVTSLGGKLNAERKPVVNNAAETRDGAESENEACCLDYPSLEVLNSLEVALEEAE